MNIKFHCPSCHQSISADTSFSGSQVQCPICAAAMIVPGTHDPVQVTPPMSKGPILASWLMIGITCLLAMIPGLGFLTWLVAAPILFVTLVLGIVALNKGATTQGILILLASIVVAPAFLFIAPIITTAIMVGATAATATTPNPKVDEVPFSEPEEPEIREHVPELVISAPEKPKETAPAPKPPSFPSMGENVTLRDSTWKVLEARDFGQTIRGDGVWFGDKTTAGKYIYVRYQLTNNTKEEDLIVVTPTLRDSQNRKFNELTFSEGYLPEGETGLTLEGLPAGVPKIFGAIFEVPVEEETFFFMARSLSARSKQEIPVKLVIEEGKLGMGLTSSDFIKEMEGATKDLREQTEGALAEVFLGDLINQSQDRGQSQTASPSVENLPNLKGEFAAVEAKITHERARWQEAMNTINRLTNNKRTPVKEGSYAYHQCMAASKVINEVESGAQKLSAEKARLEAVITELERQVNR